MFSCWFKAKYKSNGESEDLWAMAFFKMLAKQVWSSKVYCSSLVITGRGVSLRMSNGHQILSILKFLILDHEGQRVQIIHHECVYTHLSMCACVMYVIM
jgi:hypothetical protein